MDAKRRPRSARRTPSTISDHHRLQVAAKPSRRMGASMNCHDAEASPIVTPASMSHIRGEVAA